MADRPEQVKVKVNDLIANRFRVIEELGTGAMGVVWLVEELGSGQRVALKQVAADLGGDGQLRFRQEFRLMTQLRHPNCCQVQEYGQLEDGTPFFTMEVVPGHGLDELLPMDDAAILKLLPPLLAAMGHVHELGFVHRDIKSQNVRVTPDGTVKLMDFGLIEYSGTSDLPVAGTLGYLAPEVVMRGALDQRADLYALGALIFELATGRLPFERPTRGEVLRAHLSEPPPRLLTLRPATAPVLSRVVDKLLAKSPQERFQSIGEVLAALGFEAGRASRTLLAPPMVGREHHTARLEEALARLVRGEGGGTVVLQGPAGIGKSRVIRDFRAALQLEGAVPVATGAGRGEDGTPYAPFREVLRALMPTLRECVPEQLGWSSPVLSALLPELASDEPREELEDAVQERLRLQATVQALLSALAARRPYVLILEDWHAADALSRELLEYLQRNMGKQPVLRILATRQPPDPQPDWWRGCELLPVERLGAEGVRQVVAAVLSQEALSEAFVATMAQMSEGNPFHIQRLLDHLVRQEVLTLSQQGWDTSVPVDPARLPRDLQGLLLRKLAELPEDAILVARVAAVLGWTFDLTVVEEVTGFSDDRLLDAIDALLRQGIWVQGNDRKTSWSQALFQDVIYESFTPEHRTAMHAKVALALEKRIGRTKLREAPFELVKAVADHYIVGCRPDKIVTFAIEVGRRSAALFATREAERYLASALALLKADADPRWDKPRLLALRVLGDTRRLSGDIPGARACYTQAIPLAAKVGASMYQARMLTALADCHTSEDNLVEAVSCCEQSLAVSLAAGDKESAARSYHTSGALRYMLGDLPQALAQTQQALALAREVDDRATVAEALAFLGHLYVAALPEQTEAGVAHLEEAIGILTDLGHKVGLQNAFNLLGAAYHRLGEFRKADMAFVANLDTCFELGLREEEGFARLNLAITAYELGALEAGLTEVEAAAGIAAESNLPLVHALAVTFRAPGLAQLGRLAEASRAMAEATRLFSASNNKMLEARVLEHRVALLLHLGRAQEALETAVGLRQMLRATGNSEPEGHVLAMLGEARAQLGDLAGAREALSEAMRLAQRDRAQGLQVKVRRLHVWLLLRADAHEEALRAAKFALELANRLGMRLQAAELLGLIGEAQIALADGEALATFTAMAGEAEAMGARLQEALARFGQAAARPYDAGAKALVARAQQLVQGLVAGLDEAAIRQFFSLAERQRVFRGNHIDFSIAKRRTAPPLGPKGLPFGLNKL
ncbi:MAG: AAA family ATPase [Candidatus Sericytochromatia bacterium]|nr:AAA family ATPase [Candidatus Sericytochromatia bacterium]